MSSTDHSAKPEEQVPSDAKALVDELVDEQSPSEQAEAAPAEAQADAEVPKESADSDEKKSSDSNEVQVILSRDSSMRKKIRVALGFVKAGKTVTVSGFGANIPKAISLASIVCDRVGEVHRVNSFIADKDPRTERYGSGIEIVLSTSELDTENVGYQRPKPRGYISALLSMRRESTKKEKEKAPRGKDKEADKKADKEPLSTDKKDRSEAVSKSKKKRRQRRKVDKDADPKAAEAAPKEQKKDAQDKKEQRSDSAEKPKRRNNRRRRQRRPSQTDEARAKAQENQRKDKSQSGSRGDKKAQDSVREGQSQSQRRRRQERRPQYFHDDRPPMYRDFPPSHERYHGGRPFDRFDENLPPYRGQPFSRGRGYGGPQRPGYYAGQRDFRGSKQPLLPTRLEPDNFGHQSRRFPYPSQGAQVN